MPSFDVVSKVDWSEIGNALDQARREVGQRFDFKGTEVKFEQNEQTITILANADDRVNAALDVLREKLVRRKVSLRYLDVGELAPARMGAAKRVLTIKEGISQENAKVLVKLIKDSKLKVQAAIHEDAVRISGKKRDDLQAAMAAIKSSESLKIELQFTNFRE
jgi:uncharacterized protein YajQ (UPF0234 family)